MRTVCTVAPGVLAQELDGETILLDSTSGTYFRLNETGTRVWEAVVEGRSPEEVVGDLVNSTGADLASVRADVAALLALLASKGLVSTAA